LAAVAMIAAIATLFARLSRMTPGSRLKPGSSQSQRPDGSPSAQLSSSPQNSVTPNSVPVSASPLGSTSPTTNADASASQTLIIPVPGVRPDQLLDTFSAARSEGRVHDAIDIPAAHGTPVLAAADGLIVKLFQSERGGITIYQLSSDGKLVYYYAHLDRYADGLTESHFAKQGETIAYVGDTGNAGSGNYHLHFSIAEISSPKDFWHGRNINPYPLLRK
jgi:murein DD-endopeptidase MepM/ murein hydrolase activator NlpD